MNINLVTTIDLKNDTCHFDPMGMNADCRGILAFAGPKIAGQFLQMAS